MTTPCPVDGVDISHWQDGDINLVAARRAGVQWMYHKSTEGNEYKDPNYGHRRNEARNAGLPFGGYHFARPGERGDAANEARHFLRTATPRPGDLLPALDLETMEGLSLSYIRTWARTWCTVVREAINAQPIVYTPFDLGDSIEDALVWRPRYNNDNRPPTLPWDIWQFSNGTYGVPKLVAGFGHVDLNTMRPGLSVDDMLFHVAEDPDAL